MIGIDAIVLFVLVVKFLTLFTVRSSVYLFALTENYLAFSVVPLLVLGLYTTVSLIHKKPSTAPLRIGMVVALGIFLIGSLFSLQIVARNHSLPYLYIHDGSVQTEDAIAALRSGKNPYAIDYSQRTFGAFPDGFSEATRPNPAWTHHVYLPLQLLVGLPLAALSQRLFGFFDMRFVYLVSFIVTVVSAALLQPIRERRIIVLILMLFNPVFIQFFLSGFNDIFFLAWIALGSLLLKRQHWLWAGLAFGAAFASKQSAWFLIPFYVAYLYATAGATDRFRVTIRRLLPAFVVAGVIIVPFFLWSPSDFIDDTIRYASGSTMLSYPISGSGLGQLLLSAGVIHSQWDNYPFWIFQVLLGVPLLVVLIRWQLKNATVSRMLAAYGVFSFAMWFVSRFFNDSYVGVLSVIFLLSYAAHTNKDTA